MEPKFKLYERVQVDVRRWLGMRNKGKAKWKPAMIMHIFSDGTYDTTVGIYHEDAMRSMPEEHHDTPSA